MTLIPKPGKDTSEKWKLWANITDEHRCKKPWESTCEQNSTTH
jgi:hypothetical protein